MYRMWLANSWSLCKLPVEKGIPLDRHRPPARQEGIDSSSNSSSKEWIREEVLLLSVTKNGHLSSLGMYMEHVHPFQCLHGCHRERLAIDEALYSVAVFQWFLCLWEGFFRLVLGKCGKTTRVALRKALECLACHPRVRLLARATLAEGRSWTLSRTLGRAMLDALLYFKVHYRHLMQNFVVFQTILQEMSSVNLEV